MKKSVIISIILLSLVFLSGITYWTLMTFAPSEAPVANIYSEGVLVRTILLSQDSEFSVENDYGYNKIVVKNGTIYVTEASCPDKVCIKTGTLSSVGAPIICLPNRLEIIIASANDTIDTTIN